ncbi:MAG: hypothetical protein ACK53Y_12950, partial [bacterium]
NMAEAVGFILGEYTIPSDLPIIYITDSNNARTLQRRVKNKDDFTHRHMVQYVKQGIDSSIANHLEYLTSKWPKEDQLSAYTRRLYSRGEQACRIWAHKPGLVQPIQQQDDESLLDRDENINNHINDDDSINSLDSQEYE